MFYAFAKRNIGLRKYIGFVEEIGLMVRSIGVFSSILSFDERRFRDFSQGVYAILRSQILSGH